MEFITILFKVLTISTLKVLFICIYLIEVRVSTVLLLKYSNGPKRDNELYLSSLS